MPPEPAFDPNAAIRQFNEYFSGLLKRFGDAGLRSMGITPRDIAALQGGLRRLQLDNSATPEQHSAALRDAMSSLGNLLTSPELRGTGLTPVAQMPSINSGAPAQPAASTPTAEQLARHEQELKSNLNIVSSRWDPTAGAGAGAYEYTVSPTPMPTPMPTPPQVVTPPPIAMPDTMPPMANPAAANPISNFIANMNAPAAQPVTPPAAVAAPSMNTQPGADFDRNIFTRMLNDQFSQLRQKYGDAGLRSAGFTPSTLAGLQGNLRRLSMDPNSTYDQNSAALEAALASMNSYNFGGGQAQPQVVSAQRTPVPEVPQPVAMPQPIAMPAPQPGPMPPPLPQEPQVVTPMPVPGMYRGGFAAR